MKPTNAMPPTGAPGAQAGAVNYGMPPGGAPGAQAGAVNYGMPPGGAPGAQAGAMGAPGAQAGAVNYGMPPGGAPGAQAGAMGAPGAQAGAVNYGMPPGGAPGAHAGAMGAPGAQAGAMGAPGAQAGAMGAPGAQAGAVNYGMPPGGAPGAQAGAMGAPGAQAGAMGAPGAQAGAVNYGMPPGGAPGAHAGAMGAPGAQAGAMGAPGAHAGAMGAPGAQAGAMGAPGAQAGAMGAPGAHAGAMGPQPGYGMPPGAHAGAMPGQPMPYGQQYPGYGMPGQPMPGQPMPGQPMPYGQPMPGQPMPYGQPMPGQPMPGQPMPYGQPMPGQPMPYGQPMPGQPMPYGQPMPGQPMPYGQPMPGHPSPGQPIGQFSAAQDARRLREAMKGLGTDDRVLIDIIGHRTREQRVAIRDEYSRTIHRDLLKDLASETSGNYRTVLLKLMQPRDEMLAELAHDAMAGLGTNDGVLIDILTQFPYELPAIMAAYQRRYRKSLEAAVKSETSGNYGKLLNALITTRRPPPTMIDMGRATSDAEAFYRAGEGRLGTDERTYIAIIAGNSQEQLRLMDQEYRRTHPKGMAGAIKSETSGHFKEALLACITPSDEYFADRIHDSVVGAGTADFALITAFVANERPQLQRIAQVYQARHGKPMAKRVADDVSGDYKRILMALLQ